MASLQIDKFYDHKVTWNEKLRDSESQEYLQLEFEAVRAVSEYNLHDLFHNYKTERFLPTK